MGVFYGAASLWQWRLHPDEPGHGEYFVGKGAGWREALDFEGSRYVGLVGKIVGMLPFLDMALDWTHAVAHRALGVPGKLLLVYRAEGGPVRLKDDTVPRHVTLIDPRTGDIVGRRHLDDHPTVAAIDAAVDAGEGPVVLAFTQEPVDHP